MVRSLAIFAAALRLSGAGSAHAAGDAGDHLFAGTSNCPAPASVRAELETLLPRERLDARLRAIGGPNPPVEIVDLGVPFKVVAAGNVREYRDEARDCAYRARIAAVFVALVVDPAAILVAPVATPSPPPPAASASSPEAVVVGLGATPTSAPARARQLIAIGAAVEAGVGPDARVAQMGLELRVAFGAGRVALALGAAALAPVDTSVGGVRLRHWRLPADVSVRAQGTVRVGARRLLVPFAEVGAGVALVRERALDLATREAQAGLELGVRGAVGFYLGGTSRLVPFLALHGEFVPSPPAVFALPRGVVGHTPALWFGAAAGVAWGTF
jgi:hypothetical protein